MIRAGMASVGGDAEAGVQDTPASLQPREYLYYRIWMWPFPINTTGTVLTLQVRGGIAINTIDANRF